MIQCKCSYRWLVEWIMVCAVPAIIYIPKNRAGHMTRLVCSAHQLQERQLFNASTFDEVGHSFYDRARMIVFACIMKLTVASYTISDVATRMSATLKYYF